ncbi:MAG TPA: hypothetical protein VKN99_24525 [Polyangia bacterium]|nr:hypothetical protein [Polyangia bacterium]
MRKLAFVLVFSIFQVGCGDDTKPPPPACGPPPCTAGSSFDTSGRFGILVKLLVDVQAAAVINATALESDLLLLADVTQQGTNVNMQVQVCDLVLPPVPVKNQPPLTFTLPPALLASVGTVSSSGTFAGTTTCSAIMQPSPLTIILGAKASMPLTDPLPTVNTMTGAYMACGGSLMACASAPVPASGSCVCDQESDGKPGATLGVMNAPVFPDLDKAYVALRSTVRLVGKVYSSDLMAGTVNATLEEVVLGCHKGGSECDPNTVGLVAAVAPVITQTDASHDCTLNSVFTAKRVPAAIDCAALKAMEGQLFGR